MSVLKVDTINEKTTGSGVNIPGHVIQVVSNTVTTRQSTSSSTFVSTDIAATITPKYSTSKILVMASSTYSNEGAGRSFIATIYRGSTNLAGGTDAFVQGLTDGGGGTRIRSGLHMSYMDSPSTTSATTYTVYFRSSTSNLVELPPLNNVPQTMTLMEIAQ